MVFLIKEFSSFKPPLKCVGQQTMHFTPMVLEWKAKPNHPTEVSFIEFPPENVENQSCSLSLVPFVYVYKIDKIIFQKKKSQKI